MLLTPYAVDNANDLCCCVLRIFSSSLSYCRSTFTCDHKGSLLYTRELLIVNRISVITDLFTVYSTLELCYSCTGACLGVAWGGNCPYKHRIPSDARKIYVKSKKKLCMETRLNPSSFLPHNAPNYERLYAPLFMYAVV